MDHGALSSCTGSWTVILFEESSISVFLLEPSSFCHWLANDYLANVRGKIIFLILCYSKFTTNFTDSHYINAVGKRCFGCSTAGLGSLQAFFGFGSIHAWSLLQVTANQHYSASDTAASDFDGIHLIFVMLTSFIHTVLMHSVTLTGFENSKFVEYYLHFEPKDDPEIDYTASELASNHQVALDLIQ